MKTKPFSIILRDEISAAHNIDIRNSLKTIDVLMDSLTCIKESKANERVCFLVQQLTLQQSQILRYIEILENKLKMIHEYDNMSVL